MQCHITKIHSEVGLQTAFLTILPTGNGIDLSAKRLLLIIRENRFLPRNFKNIVKINFYLSFNLLIYIIRENRFLQKNYLKPYIFNKFDIKSHFFPLSSIF